MSNSNMQQSPSSLSAKRIDYIDTAKGLLIILVVFGHCQITYLGPISILLMPAFFAISGLFFKPNDGFRTMLVKKCNKILIPFLFFYTIAYLIIIAKVCAGADIDHSFVAFFVDKDRLSVNGVVWFLLALFWANLLFYALCRISSNMIFLALASLSLMAMSLLLFTGENALPFYLDAGLTAMPFFCLGYCLRKTEIIFSDKYNRYLPYIIPALCAIAAVCYVVGGEPCIIISCNEVSGSAPLFMLFSTALIMAVLFLSKAIGFIPIVTYMGRYSLIIFCFHMPVVETVGHCLLLAGFDIFTVPVNIVVFIVSLCITTLTIKPFIRWFPKFTAQKDLIALSHNTRPC